MKLETWNQSGETRGYGKTRWEGNSKIGNTKDIRRQQQLWNTTARVGRQQNWKNKGIRENKKRRQYGFGRAKYMKR